MSEIKSKPDLKATASSATVKKCAYHNFVMVFIRPDKFDKHNYNISLLSYFIIKNLTKILIIMVFLFMTYYGPLMRPFAKNQIGIAKFFNI